MPHSLVFTHAFLTAHQAAAAALRAEQEVDCIVALTHQVGQPRVPSSPMLCSLLTAHYLLPTNYCSLPTAHCSLQDQDEDEELASLGEYAAVLAGHDHDVTITSHGPRRHQSPATTHYSLLTTHHSLPTHHSLLITYHSQPHHAPRTTHPVLPSAQREVKVLSAPVLPAGHPSSKRGKTLGQPS